MSCWIQTLFSSTRNDIRGQLRDCELRLKCLLKRDGRGVGLWFLVLVLGQIQKPKT